MTKYLTVIGGIATLDSVDILPVQRMLATVNFATPANSKTFTIAALGAVVGQSAIAAPSLDMPAGIDKDEFEMEPFTCAAYAIAANQIEVTLTACSPHGLLLGQKRISILY